MPSDTQRSLRHQNNRLDEADGAIGCRSGQAHTPAIAGTGPGTNSRSGHGVGRDDLPCRHSGAGAGDANPGSREEPHAPFVGGTVILRTFDVGADKPVPYFKLPAEDNPFLGYRGIRVYEGHRELLRAQMRAILRASALGRVQMMMPMVAAREEILWVKTQLAE